MLTTSPLFALLDIGGGEMVVIFLVVLLLFGGQRMPELARGLGKSIREFKKVTSGVEDQIKQAIDEAPRTPVDLVQKSLAAPAPKTALPASPSSPTPPPATPEPPPRFTPPETDP